MSIHLSTTTTMLRLSRTAVRAGRTSRPLTASRTFASQSAPSTSKSSVPAEEARSTTGTALPAKQSPNFPTTWSTSQRSRAEAYQDARFEQTISEFQPQPLSAMELIAQEPVRFVHGRIAECDGGAYMFLVSRELELNLVNPSRCVQ